jgi:hypothetical protein
VPQAARAFPGWQAPLSSQQPLGQFCAEQLDVLWHWPLALQVVPDGQLSGGHTPVFPQPSSPHSRPAQFGAQHMPEVLLHWLAGAWQQTPRQQKVLKVFGLGPLLTGV